MQVTLDSMKSLIFKLNNASNEYYNNNNEIITNFEFDKMVDELKHLEDKTGIQMSNSPTQRVGYEVQSNLEKVKHKVPLLSLNKTKSVDDLYKFMSKGICLLGVKLDGISVELLYENGELVQGATRGNGTEGENITQNIKTFVNIPKTIPYKKSLRVVGEAIIDYFTFDEINSNLEIKYKNPRNLVSGSVRQLDTQKCAERDVKFIAFGINEGFEEIDSKTQSLIELDMMGFETYDYWIVEPIDTHVENILDSIRTNKEEYPLDGVVITYNSKEYSESLGVTQHHPKHSLAFKWEDESEYTTLRDIEIDVGKIGQVSYTAVFDPVEIEGTTVERATLHNYEYIKELKLGIGDEIGVIKANMIIPQVVENLTENNTYPKIEKCPFCDSVLEHKDGGVHQFCSNKLDCPKQILGKLIHFASRDAMDIEHLNDKTIKSIMSIKNENGESLLKTVSDVYYIPLYRDELLKLERFGKKKVNNIIEAIEKSKSKPLSNVLYGLSIPQVGKKASKTIAEAYPDRDKLLKTNRGDIKSVTGVSVGDSFANNRQIIEKELGFLKIMGLSLRQETEEKSSELKDKTFVITGKLNHFTNRKELQAKIENLGGKVSSSVTKNTSYLINNDKESNSSKNKNAKKLNIKIISEDEFLKILEGGVKYV